MDWEWVEYANYFWAKIYWRHDVLKHEGWIACWKSQVFV